MLCEPDKKMDRVTTGTSLWTQRKWKGNSDTRHSKACRAELAKTVGEVVRGEKHQQEVNFQLVCHSRVVERQLTQDKVSSRMA